MDRIIKCPKIIANTKQEIAAADILKQELFLRTEKSFFTECSSGDFSFIFCEKPEMEAERFLLTLGDNALRFTAAGIRGLIFAIGRFLRKSEYRDGCILLNEDIAGDFAPQKRIRGHQLGFRHCANTYDAWMPAQFYRYSLELMFFGSNTVEHIPKTKDAPRAPLMPMDENELLKAVSKDADALDLDVSLWIPNDTEDIEASVKIREEIFRGTSRINDVFIPGSDPGDLPPQALFAHCAAINKALYETHPEARLWVSAQAPHNRPNWGEEFIEAVNENEESIYGVITGPNRAFPMDTLRRRLPSRLPVRFYPDITHNVRCEHPVHFLRDDWHYAYAAALSRECCNPRPMEYAQLHRLTSPYTVGSVSYSEGVNDDVNKAVWSALEWDENTPVREILADYARLYLYGADIGIAVDALAGLELNWNAPPDLNPQIDHTLKLWETLGEKTPTLKNNWRYVQCLFRAQCDAYIRRRFIFENELTEKAKRRMLTGDPATAQEILNTSYPREIITLREELALNADRLNALIGLQLSVDKHGASGWERGATLDTVDRPITDLPWLKLQLEKAQTFNDPASYMRSVAQRNRVEPDERYFSVALHGLEALGLPQQGEFYMDFQGDRANVNNGSLPISLQKLYDHTSFRCKLGGFTENCDYTLRVTYKNNPDENSTQHKITANGHVIYEGKQFGGTVDAEFTNDLLPAGFVAVRYALPAAVFENGCLTLEITEPTVGFELAEFFIIKEEASRI